MKQAKTEVQTAETETQTLEAFKKDLNAELKPLLETFIDLQVNLSLFQRVFVEGADELEDQTEADQAFELLKNCGIDSIEASHIRFRFIDRKWERLTTQPTQEKEPYKNTEEETELAEATNPADGASIEFRKFIKALKTNLKIIFKDYLDLQSQADGFYSKFGKLAKAFEDEEQSEQALEILETSGIDEVKDNIFKQRFIEVALRQLNKLEKATS